jgi:hypothetical protein
MLRMTGIYKEGREGKKGGVAAFLSLSLSIATDCHPERSEGSLK